MAIDLQELKDALKDNLTITLSNPPPDVENGQATKVVLKWGEEIISSSDIQNVGEQSIIIYSGVVKSATKNTIITEEDLYIDITNEVEVNNETKNILSVDFEKNEITIVGEWTTVLSPGDEYKIVTKALELS